MIDDLSPNYSVKLSLYVGRRTIIPQNTHIHAHTRPYTHTHTQALTFTLDEYTRMLINHASDRLAGNI